MQSLAFSTAASSATARATAADRRSSVLPESKAAAASAATARICSARHSIHAQMCLIAWNSPILRPNCSRTFAYSVAVSRHQPAMPAASAATSVAAASSTEKSGSKRRSAATATSVQTTRASGTLWSSPASGSTRSPAASPSISAHRCRSPSRTGTSTAAPGAAPGTESHSPDTEAPDSPTDIAISPPSATPHGVISSSASPVTSPANAVESTGPPTRSCAACSTRTARSPTVPPAPPASSGTATRKTPRSARRGQYSRQNSGAPERSVAIGRTAAAHPRIDSWTALFSSVVAMVTLHTAFPA